MNISINYKIIFFYIISNKNSVNIIPRSSLSSDLFGKSLSTFKRFIMLIAFSVTFSSLISSFWIFFAKYATGNYTMWAGFVLLIQSLLLFIWYVL